MLRAISFGVFCRSAPSISAIIRSRKEFPRDEVMRMISRSEITVVPPVTADRSPPDSRITGADSPVIAASLTEATPSITSPSPGMTSPASTRTRSPDLEVLGRSPLVELAIVGGEQPLCGRGGARGAQGVGLRLASTLGHRLGEVGEEEREPQPQDDLEAEAEMVGARRQVAQEEDGGEERHDLDDEHHRVADHLSRVELAEGRAQGGHDDLRARTGQSWVWT